MHCQEFLNLYAQKYGKDFKGSPLKINHRGCTDYEIAVSISIIRGEMSPIHIPEKGYHCLYTVSGGVHSANGRRSICV